MRTHKKTGLNRREFIKGSVAGLVAYPAMRFARDPSPTYTSQTTHAKVALIKTTDRATAVKEVLQLAEYAPARGKQVYIKPNFNTSDPTPGSTHNETLRGLAKAFHDHGAHRILVGDRSGPEPTAEVLIKKGVWDMAKELDFEVLHFSELGTEDWVLQNPSDSHWENGFLFARQALESEYTVSTCCLKTHQYGGVFSMSLKLSVGLVPRKQMGELHQSPNMRKMIAEINSVYKPELVVLDGIQAFVDEGPMTGPVKNANIFLAGNDRVAIDAVGIAILKELGSNQAIMDKKIFEQEQIQRAAELGLGVGSPDQIEFVTDDSDSKAYAAKLKSILAQG